MSISQISDILHVAINIGEDGENFININRISIWSAQIRISHRPPQKVPETLDNIIVSHSA
jgi:hypothetical protein